MKLARRYWHCEFCGKANTQRIIIENHAINCVHNPLNIIRSLRQGRKQLQEKIMESRETHANIIKQFKERDKQATLLQNQLEEAHRHQKRAIKEKDKQTQEIIKEKDKQATFLKNQLEEARLQRDKLCRQTVGIDTSETVFDPEDPSTIN